MVVSETIGRVRRLVLNRPEKLNAWNSAMRRMLIDELALAEQDQSVRALIITGAGSRAFGAGQDLSESKHFQASDAAGWMQEWLSLYQCFRLATKPIVAAVNGVAAGSAFQVALLCDFRIAHPGVTMGQPEIKSGIPTVTGNWVMRELIGLARTVDLTLTGRMLSAEEAFTFGLISRIVPEDDVQAAALALADAIRGQIRPRSRRVHVSDS